MKTVCVYDDPTMYGEHGITAAVRHQKKALRAAGAEVKSKPSGSFDLIHLNWYGPISYLRLKQAQRRGKLAVVYAHSGRDVKGGFTLSNFLSTPFINWLVYFYNSGDLVIAPSQYTKDMIIDFGVEPSKVSVISNGVDHSKVSFSSQKRRKYRDKFDLEKPTVISVGQVIPRKAIPTFVEVARRLPKYQFVWYGHRMNRLFMYDREMDRAISNAPANVQFTGYVDDIQAAYSSGDLFFFPSHEENQGIVLLEAAVCGLPIVARELPVYKGWLKHGENSLQGNGVEEFVDLIQKAMNEEELRDRLTTNARQLAEEHHLEKIGRELLQLYSEVI